jgi:hypothetical protein
MQIRRLLQYTSATGLLLFSALPQAKAQADEAWYQKAQRYNAQQKRAPAKSLSLSTSSPSYRTLGATVSSCDVGINGDFENQLAIPSHVNNMGGDFGGTRQPDQLSNWYSPSAGSPDYFGTNATATSDVQPSNENSPYGSFTPYVSAGTDPIRGAVGLYARQAYTEVQTGIVRDRTSEYAQVALPNNGLITGAQYYADFQVSLSHRTATSLATNYGINNGFGLVFTTTALSQTGRDFIAAPSDAKKVLSTTPLLQNAINFGTTGAANWQRVSGQFPGGGERYLTVGLFNPDASNLVLLPNGQADLFNTYFFVDAVRIFKIPTAGPAATVPCGGSVSIGEGCVIPGATYSWSAPGLGTFASSTTNIQTTVSPAATTTYTLTVTLPDQSTYVTSTTVGTTKPVAPGIITGSNDHTAGRLTAQIDALPGATSYNWYKDGVLNTTNHNPSVIWIVSRTTCDGATVSVEAVYGCGTSTRISQYFPGEFCNPRMSAASYPNPAVDALTVETTGQQGQATLFNASGRAYKTITLHEGTVQTVINTHDLPAGIYHLRIVQQGEAPVDKQIVIQH